MVSEGLAIVHSCNFLRQNLKWYFLTNVQWNKPNGSFASGSEADPGDGGQHRQAEARDRGEGGADVVGADAAVHPVWAAECGTVPGRGAVPTDRGGDEDQRVGRAAPAQTRTVTGLTQGTVWCVSVLTSTVSHIDEFNKYHKYHYTEHWWIEGGVRNARPLSVQFFFSISCSFRGRIAESAIPPFRVDISRLRNGGFATAEYIQVGYGFLILLMESRAYLISLMRKTTKTIRRQKERNLLNYLPQGKLCVRSVSGFAIFYWRLPDLFAGVDSSPAWVREGDRHQGEHSVHRRDGMSGNAEKHQHPGLLNIIKRLTQYLRTIFL